MRSVLLLLFVVGVFQNAFSLECYVCQGDDCGKNDIESKVCAAEETTTTVGPTTETTLENETETTLLPEETTEATDETTLVSDDTTESSDDTTIIETTPDVTTGDTEATTDTNSGTEIPNVPQSQIGVVLVESSRKKRSLQYYREADSWKCFTQKDKDGKVTGKGCKLKEAKCSTEDFCHECTDNKCNGSTSLRISLISLAVILIGSKFF